MANIDVFDALANPTRRQILAILRTSPRSVNELTASVHVSQPAVSQHLAVLHAAQLVQVQRKGNQRIYHLDAGGLSVLRQYVDSFWDGVLEAYFHEAEQSSKED